MIINSQAFNARGKDARRISMKLDEFRSRRPIDIIAKTNPILIIDEPQSVEGKQTKENLKQFNPLLTLRYSATHKSDSIYNMVYRLDAMEAYNKRLVKKIAVRVFRNLAVLQRKAMYIWRVSTFPRLRLRQRFSLIIRVRVAFAKLPVPFRKDTIYTIIPAVWKSINRVLWCPALTDAMIL